MSPHVKISLCQWVQFFLLKKQNFVLKLVFDNSDMNSRTSFFVISLPAYLNPNTLLYVWDNYIIGLDTPGFTTEWLAIVLVTILALTKDKIKEASSVSWTWSKLQGLKTTPPCSKLYAKCCLRPKLCSFSWHWWCLLMCKIFLCRMSNNNQSGSEKTKFFLSSRPPLSPLISS